MKKSIAVACLLGAAAAFGSGSLPAAEQKGPRIEIREERFDLGSVTEGVEAVHIFEFRNAGDQELVIQKVQTS